MNVRDWLADKFSWSKLNTFAMCPRMAFYRYVMKRKMPPTLAILFGRGVHGGQEVDCYAKLRGEQLSTDQVLDAAVAEFEEDPSRKELDASVDDFVAEHRTQLEKFEKSGERAKVVPVPGTVEAAFQFELDVLDSNGETRTPALVEGYVDVISEGEDGRAAVNYKASKAPLSQVAANKHLQLTMEMLGAGVEKGRVVTFIRQGKQKAGSKVVRTSMGEEKKAKAFQFLADTIAGFRAALKTGDFPKCAPTNYYCSPQGCEFYRLCYPETVEETTRFVQVTKILPAGSLPAAEWRESKAGRAERLKSEAQYQVR